MSAKSEIRNPIPEVRIAPGLDEALSESAPQKPDSSVNGFRIVQLRPSDFALCSTLFLLLTLLGCTNPVGATRTSPRVAFKQLSRSALNHDMSDSTREIVHRYHLDAELKHHPEHALAALHAKACAGDERELLFALAELNYHRGEVLERSVKPGVPRRAPDYFLSSALYAWFFLLGDSREPAPGPFDQRFRVACDLYNRAVARGFAAGPPTNSVVQPAGGSRDLAPGRVEVRLSESAMGVKLETVEEFLPADDFLVYGLSARNRQSGLGAPLIGITRPPGEDRLMRRRFPATLFLRVPGNLQAWGRGELKLELELYANDETNRVQVAGQSIPLESDTTAPLAHRLNDSQLWKLGSLQFFSADQRVKNDLYSIQPFQRGKVPVIFVHGTFSSPVWWAEMLNTLYADPVLREKCQFWCFVYNSGNPVVYSAVNLRNAIEQRLRVLDPEGTDAALKRMVVIGHSQGGLLAKLTGTDTGDKLWRAFCNQDFEKLKLKEKERQLLQSYFFFEPSPSVERLVFIATPHRGSYRSTSFVRRLSRRFMSFPGDLVRGAGAAFHQLQGQADIPTKLRHTIPSSLDGMSPENPMLLALADIPPAAGVTCHSVIPVQGDGPPDEGGDGVVKYSSAHVNYAASEFIIRSGHSCQSQPPTIGEVRRILLEHLASAPPVSETPAVKRK